jgi:putative hemolysin
MGFRELSYASDTDPLWKRSMIRSIECLSGRRRFIPVYRTWQSRIPQNPGRVMTDLLHLTGTRLDIVSPAWPPRVDPSMPLVIMANHPYGIGDGIAILSLAEQLGRPFRILIHRELLKVPEIREFALPVDFSETREAFRFNRATRDHALRLIAEGTVIVIFPAGAVATADRPFGRARELPWKTFGARLVESSRASVLPVYFEGQNSWVFHAASRFSETLRLSLLVSEFRNFAGSTVRVRIGPILPYEALAGLRNRRALTEALYQSVHRLGVGSAVDSPSARTSAGGGVTDCDNDELDVAHDVA